MAKERSLYAMQQFAVNEVRKALEGADVCGHALIVITDIGDTVAIQTICGGELDVVTVMQGIAQGAALVGKALDVSVHVHESAESAGGSVEVLH